MRSPSMNFFGDPVDGALIADYVQPVGGGGRVRLLNWSVIFERRYVLNGIQISALRPSGVLPVER
jgi:hypothetical protein